MSDKPPTVSRSEKVTSRHLDRLAVVYVRQSSLQQVHRNQESTRLQYGLVNTAYGLGWSADRVEVIDDDLGMSGSSAEGRSGFQRLLAEIALDQVGVVLGVDMSRLARSNKDWHHLLELCARFGTLIADLDGLYDPVAHNDRLLLGLKGTMSEAELHVLRQRLLQGKLQKARRGALGLPVPTGYLRKPGGEVVLDPDEEVQGAVRAVFDAFGRRGTVSGTLLELVGAGLMFGVRSRRRENLGDLSWHRPHRGMVSNILRHPVYAGVYAYGRRSVDPRKKQPGRPATGRTPLLPQDEWKVCLDEALPAYISREIYEQNQRQLAANRSKHEERRGTTRQGNALLQGLLFCGRCGLAMGTQYSTRGGESYGRYTCGQARQRYGSAHCQSLAAPCVDEVVTQLAMAALAPAALELSLRASENLEQERAREDELWQKRLERAAYEAHRAERQYRAVEPENRLVARTLESAWEEKLSAEMALQDEYARHRRRRPRQLTDDERVAIRSLAANIPTIWHAPSTSNADRKAILGLLVDRVVLWIEGSSEQARLTLHWSGGHETTEQFYRPVGKMTQLSSSPALLEAIAEMRAAGHPATVIAEMLNHGPWRTAHGQPFNERTVRALVDRHELTAIPIGRRPPPAEHDWWLHDLATELEMPRVTLYGWLRRGWVTARRVRGSWVVRADVAELDRLRRLRLSTASAGSPMISTRHE